MKWYVVNVYSGFEHKVLKVIYEQAERKKLSFLFGEILIPSEDVIEIKKGAKTKTSRNFFPGYILVQMTLTDDTWHLVRAVPKVSSFLGAKGKPQAISTSEVERIVKKVADIVSNVNNVIIYEIGDVVKVCEGPFATFQGIVEEADMEKERVKVSVSIFGRPTNVDLSFSQVEKVS